VYVRSSRLNHTSPLVIHLISWNIAVTSIRISVDRNMLPDGALRVILLEPLAYDSSLHADAEKKKNYSALAASTVLNGDITKGISVPMNNTWSIIVIDKK
jgi:hypothetical protein